MSSTAPAVRRSTVPVRTAGILGVIGGLVMVGDGLAAALRTSLTDHGGWFVVAGIASLLLVVAILGLRDTVSALPVARRALGVSAAGLTLFAAAHFYAVADQDTAILLFSIFMVVASIAMIVAGVVISRAGVWAGRSRFVPLVVGVWPLATIPAGAAIGDLPHFLAIAVWGLCWTALGLTLLRADVAVPAAAAAQPATSAR